MSRLFRKLSAAIGITPKSDQGNHDVSKLPLTATLDASDEAFDLASGNGGHVNDDMAFLKKKLEKVTTELLAARSKQVDEVACSNGSDHQLPKPQHEPTPRMDQAAVIESLQRQLLLKDQALTDKRMELSAIADCSENILTYATAISDRYETDNGQLRKDLRATEASLASARATIAARDDAIKLKNAALEREQRSNSLLRSENEALQKRLQSTEQTLKDKAADATRFEQKLKDDAADHEDRVRRLHEILAGKEDALKKEQQTSLRSQTELFSLSKRLVETERAMQAKLAEITQLQQMIKNGDVEHQKSIRLLQQNIAEKDRQHAEEIDAKNNEIRAAEDASAHSQRGLDLVRSVLAADYQLIRSLISGNPRLVTVANVEDVLKLSQRHSTDCDDVKRVCEQRLDQFHNLLPATKKYELAVQYGLGFAFIKSLIIANPSVITAENFESILKLITRSGGDNDLLRICVERLRQFGDSEMSLTRKYELVSRNGLSESVIGTIVRENPFLVTEENIDEILGLADRHPSTNDATKRVCEQRIRHFVPSLALIRKCDLFLRHGLDMQLLGRIIRDNSKSLRAIDVEHILKLAQTQPCDSSAVKRECETRLRHIRELSSEQKYELANKYSLRVLEQELKVKIDAQKAAAKPFRFGLPRNVFAVEHDYDFRRTTDNGQAFRSGGLLYVRPLGCERFALKVTGKYLPDDGWLTGRGGPQWAVAYHGTTLENVAGIVRNGFDLRKGVRFAFGTGIYSSPYPKVALGYSTPYTHNGKQYKIILQVRVDPTKMTRHDNGNIYLLPDGTSIRPYAVCVFVA